MKHLLTFQAVVQVPPDVPGMCQIEVSVFEGDHYVASKIYANKDRLQLVKDARDFWVYWTRLFFDDPSDTLVTPNPNGCTQLRIFPVED